MTSDERLSGKLRSGSMHQGISQQASQALLPGQLLYAVNAVFSVKDGASKRPASRFLFHLGTGYTASDNIRMSALTISGYRYLVVFGSGFQRIFRVSNSGCTESTVTTTAAASTYLGLNSAAATDGVRFSQAFNVGYLINTTVASGTKELSGAINAATVASPTELTCTASHSLTTGDYVVITDSAGTTPSIDGTHQVTVTSATKFTIAVNVTVAAGVSANWTMGKPDATKLPSSIVRTGTDAFTIDQISWSCRRSGNSTQNPQYDLFVNGAYVYDVAPFRGRLAICGGGYIGFSKVGEPYNCFMDDYANLVDSDPVQSPKLSDQVSIDFMVPIRKSLFLFTKEGAQYEGSSASDVFKPGGFVVTPTTNLSTISTRPATISPAIYSCTSNESSAQLQEYYYDEISLPSKAEDVTGHVQDLMFLRTPTSSGPVATIRTIVSSPEAGSVLILRTAFSSPSYAGSDVFDYRSFYDGARKVQTSWSRHSIGDTYNVHDIAVIGSDLYALRGYTLDGTYNVILERYPIQPESSHRVTT